MKPTDFDDDERDALELSDGENADLCAGCMKCCSYITVEIEKPRTSREYDQWIWALHHKGISLYVQRPERWSLCVEAVLREAGRQRALRHLRPPSRAVPRVRPALLRAAAPTR